jgi:mono/diheme cytochrome c family protein
MRRSWRSSSFGLLLAVTVAAGCGDQEPQAAPPAAAPAAPGATTGAAPGSAPAGDMVAQGREVYSGAGICFTCHGPNAQGTALGPNLTDGEWIWVEAGQDLQTQLTTIIRTGVAQPRQYPAPMPPMGGANINESQLEALVAYLISLNS